MATDATERLQPSSAAATRAWEWATPDRVATAVVAAAIAVIGFEGGGYGTDARGIPAVAVWLAVAAASALGLVRLTRLSAAVCALLTGLAVFTALSIAWAASAEKAFDDVTRVALYLGLFVLVAAAARRTTASAWADGLGIGLAFIGVVALASRLFPGVFTGARPLTFVTGEQTRLAYPIGYWTALGVVVALALPLLLRATIDGSLVARALAAGVLPLLAVTLYLSSTRIGVALSLLGAAAFVLLAPHWRAVGAVAAALPASVVAVAFVSSQSRLTVGPFTGAKAESQGALTAVVLLLVAAATAAAVLVVPRFARGLRPLPSRFPALVYVAVAVAAAFVVAAANPTAHFAAFRETPAGFNQTGIQEHLGSVSSNGRWQLWSSAFDEWRSRPLGGRGAGSFEEWWAQRGSLVASARNAHSLFLETAGELGIVGFLLLVAAVAAGVVVAVRRWFGGRDRVLVTALGLTYVVWVVAAGVDWMWEIPAVTAPAIACLAVLTSHGGSWPRRGVARARPAFAVAALVVAGALAVPVLADAALRASRDAATKGDYRAAVSHALDGVGVQPWAASPYLQVALVEERAHHLAAASDWATRAIAHDRGEWRLWLTRARIEAERGRIASARRDLAVVRRLDPHSTLFQDAG